MNRLFILVALVLGLASPGWSQSVRAKLFAKAQGDDILAAVELRPAPGCWIYDDEDPGEYALASKVTMGEVAGAQWSKALFPDPTVKTGALGSNNVFKSKTIVYVAAPGAAKAGVDPAALTARFEGQVCDEGTCVNVDQSLESAGAGDEALWADFPAALLVAANEPAAAPGAQASDELLTWFPDFGDEYAKSRYFARRGEGDTVELVIQIAVPEHYHMYAGPTEEDLGTGIGMPTTFEIEGDGVDFGDVQYPEPFAVPQPDFGEGETFLWSYEGSFLFGARGEAYDEVDLAALDIQIEGQACDENGCVQVAMTPEYAGEGSDALYASAFATWELPEAPMPGGAAPTGEHGEEPAAGAAVATDGAEPASGDDVTDQSDAAAGDGTSGDGTAGDGPTASGPVSDFGDTDTSTSFIGFLWLSILAGLATLLMPCTYPMIPITISYFTKQAEARDGNVLGLALVYGAGIVLVFVLSGVVFRGVIGPFANHWITNMVFGIVFIVFALSLLGMFELRPPRFLMNVAGGASSKGGYGGVFLMGLTLVVSSFTCTGPFVGSLIAGGAKYSTLQIATGMGAFGLTMAAPFVLLAILPGKMKQMPSAGAWMNTLKVFLGFVEIAAALKFFSNADITRNWMLLPREVFLALWFAIFMVAGYFLLGRINLKGESPDGNIGPGRLLGALATISFALYCGLGAVGYRLDGVVMAALAPPPDYTRGLVPDHRPGLDREQLREWLRESLGTASLGSVSPVQESKFDKARVAKFTKATDGGTVVVDDYELAAGLAMERNLGLLINFTAHT